MGKHSHCGERCTADAGQHPVEPAVKLHRGLGVLLREPLDLGNDVVFAGLDVCLGALQHGNLKKKKKKKKKKKGKKEEKKKEKKG